MTNDRAADKARSSRLKRWSILAVLAASGLVFVAWGQPWFTLNLVDTVPNAPVIEVTGQQAAAALSAFALCGLAAGGALTIAGSVFRYVLGVLVVLLGGCAVLATTSSLGNPIMGGATQITALTGVTGRASITSLVESWSQTFWPYVGIATAVLLALSGVLVLLTARNWPKSSSKYQAVVLSAEGEGATSLADLADGSQGADADGNADDAADSEINSVDDSDDDVDESDDRISEWDRQSRGADPSQ
ncbi:Trp biosynthesis-associated membrane protein [Lysinibacter cavernae]|uniref:Putative membrane protein (TIGR02234 family) n=1 Tax=Lysinibacter cavernae TaxID=1640652 RepID=A0A7X5QZI0_9MICO|nr:Trp biosynthesis-associated membrane protein [Lysinibacter cavernae]NIH52861.1 putative membrane protein (TIGR02234 family) [Lysinibacter cavernae]